MTLDEVMAQANLFGWHSGFENWTKLRAAILSYGRAERERAAKVCDELTFAIDHGGNKYRRPAPADRCAAAIRALPDEASPSVAQGVAA